MGCSAGFVITIVQNLYDVFKCVAPAELKKFVLPALLTRFYSFGVMVLLNEVL